MPELRRFLQVNEVFLRSTGEHANWCAMESEKVGEGIMHASR
jgi:hypothetical protein